MRKIKNIDEELKQKIQEKIKILLVTSAEIEKNKVNEVMKPIDGEEEILQYNRNGYEFYIGKYGNYNVVHIQTKIGSTGDGASTIAVKNALEFWKIRMVVMVGIAFGRGKEYNQKIGDIIISREIFMYEKHKVKENKDGSIDYLFQGSPYANAGPILLKKFADDGQWKENNSERPKIHLGTIASGEKIYSSQSEKNKLLELGKLTYIVGGEMEATGMATSCSDSKIGEWIVVKGISDWGDENKLKNQKENQKVAINSAVSYCEYIFSKEKVFDEIIGESPIKHFEMMYSLPFTYNSNSIDLVREQELSLIPINNIGNKIIKREEIINQLKKEVEKGNHINIFGEIFSGKTTLMKILSLEYEQGIKYIDLSNKNESQTETILMAIYQIILEVESNNSIIIGIDNIPKLNRTSKVYDIFVSLLRKAKEKNIKIIFTSLISQEYILDDEIEDIFYINIDIITRRDVNDLLKIYEAPDYIYKDKIIEFIECNGKNKIFIVKQIIKFLQTENWDFFNNGFIGIINGKYVLKIKGEVQEILLDRISNKSQKELLYRIGCINCDLNIDEIKRISEVEPKIDNPLELLEQINGTFIEYDNVKNIYQVNPLIMQISKDNTDSQIYRGINKAMAEGIIEKRTLNPYEIMKCLGFFIQAQEYNRAGELYLQAITSMYEKNIRDEWGIKSIWKDLELPDKMDSNLKIQIRVAQLRYYMKFGIKYKQTLDLTVKLIEKEKYDDAIITGVALILLYIDPIEANKLLKLAIISENKNTDIIEKIKSDKNLNSKIMEDFGIETLLWATMPYEGDIDIFDSWVNVLTSLEREQYYRFRKVPNQFFEFEDIYANCIDRTWVELKREIPEDIEKIKRLINLNLELIKFAKIVKDDYILAISIRNIIIFKCEYLKEEGGFDFGIIEFESLDKEKSKFIVAYRIGEQYYYIKNYNDAKLWLEKALEYDNFESLKEEKIWCLLELSEIYQEENAEKSYHYAKETLRLIENLGIRNKICFYIEFIIRCFYLGKLLNNIDIYLECTKLVLQNTDNKGIVAVFVHVVSYITAYLVSQIELDKENMQYGKPYTRMTIYSDSMNGDLYTDQKVQTIFLNTLKLLVLFRNKEKVIEFSKTTYDRVIENHPEYLILFPRESIVFFIEKFMFKEAIRSLKIYNIFEENKEEILLKNSPENPLAFMEAMGDIYKSDNSINFKCIKEFYIFNIIFLLLEDNNDFRINKIKEIEELPEANKEEYIQILKLLKNRYILPQNLLMNIIIEKNKKEDTTFEIIYRLLLIKQLTGKELINNQINIILYFIRSYGNFIVEESILLLCINQLKNDILSSDIYINKERILHTIQVFENNNCINNAKKVYIEILIDLGFDDILEENIKWLKDI